jgi:hypothetical protein
MNDKPSDDGTCSVHPRPRRSNARPTGKGRSTRTGDSLGYGDVDAPECEGTTASYDRCLQLGPEAPPHLPSTQ